MQKIGDYTGSERSNQAQDQIKTICIWLPVHIQQYILFFTM